MKLSDRIELLKWASLNRVSVLTVGDMAVEFFEPEPAEQNEPAQGMTPQDLSYLSSDA